MMTDVHHFSREGNFSAKPRQLTVGLRVAEAIGVITQVSG